MIKIKKFSTSDRLKQIMNERNLKQVDILTLCEPFCKKLDVRLAKNDLSQYVSGRSDPGQDKLTILGLALNVNEVWLMGYDVSHEREALSLNKAQAITEEDKIDEQIRTRIKYLREYLLRISIAEFSAKLGISEEWYSSVESGETPLPISMLSNISKAYNVNYNWLAFEQGSIFKKDIVNKIDEISHEYGLDENSEFILESFLNFDSDKRKNLSSLILEMLSKQQERKSNLEVIEPSSVEIVRAARSSNDKDIEKKTLTNKDYKELVNKLETAPKVTELK